MNLPMTSPCVTVYIVDDDASVRDALALMFSLRGWLTATFASAEDFLAAVPVDARGCLVLDIRMQGLSGLELQQLLRERGAPMPVVIITAHGDVAAARQAFLADAVDFIEKPFDADVLLQAVHAATKRLAALPHPSQPLGAQAEPIPAVRRAETLTPREWEVLRLIAQGLHHRDVATTLGISHRTVEVHKARIMDKLGARHLIDLVRFVDAKSEF